MWLKLTYQYLAAKDFRSTAGYLVEGAVYIKEEPGYKIIAKRVDDEEKKEVFLYCHSEDREKKDFAIRSRFHQRFEEALAKLHQGLSKKGCTKRYEKILVSIGRIKQKNSRVAQDYDINLTSVVQNQEIRNSMEQASGFNVFDFAFVFLPLSEQIPRHRALNPKLFLPTIIIIEFI